MAHDAAPQAPAAQAGRRTRLFLMIAGGLAAPSLALAAFFLSGSGGSAVPSRPAATQAGRVIGSAGTAGHPSSAAPAPTTTTSTTTTAPAAPGVPPRDPFAPLVTQGPPAGTPKG
ncbi:MAG: hypothetical protein QOJ23_5134 [Actinomycetota bacterium]|nr:hypothetical protein [Actinomycetota bacterium]